MKWECNKVSKDSTVFVWANVCKKNAFERKFSFDDLLNLSYDEMLLNLARL